MDSHTRQSRAIPTQTQQRPDGRQDAASGQRYGRPSADRTELDVDTDDGWTAVEPQASATGWFAGREDPRVEKRPGSDWLTPDESISDWLAPAAPSLDRSRDDRDRDDPYDDDRYGQSRHDRDREARDAYASERYAPDDTATGWTATGHPAPTTSATPFSPAPTRPARGAPSPRRSGRLNVVPEPEAPDVAQAPDVRQAPEARPWGSDPEPRNDPARDWSSGPGAVEQRHRSTHPDVAAAPVPAPEDPRHRRVVYAVFWLGLLASVAPWCLETSAASVAGTGPVLTEAGRITGLVAGYLLLLQVVLVSRIGVLERYLGAGRLLSLHREIGGSLLVLMLAHVSLITVGYSRIDGQPVAREVWTLLSSYEDMISAFVAAGILTATGLLAIRWVRAALSYEAWHRLHLLSYGVLLLGYGHQFANGQELHSRGGSGRWLWIGMYALVVAGLLWGRVLAPAWLNLRHRLRVSDIVAESRTTVSIYVTGRRLDRMRVDAGQFFRWRFLGKGCWDQAHPFSLSAAPNGRYLRLTVKVVGDYTEAMARLRIGTRVLVSAPAGAFTARSRTQAKALLIAAGSGIAPVRALLEELPPGAAVVYRATAAQEVLFQQELDALARERDADLWYVVGSRDDPEARRLLTARGLADLVPDVADRDVYVCAPPGLVAGCVRTLRKLRVPRRQIHLDPFEL